MEEKRSVERGVERKREREGGVDGAVESRVVCSRARKDFTRITRVPE